MNKNILAALSAPFDEKVIKTKKGIYGHDIKYVPGYVVVQRLNEVLEGRWSFSVHGYELADGEVLVLGSLTIFGETKQQYGSAKITKGEDGSILSLGTDIKAASSDCLKRCSSGFSILDSLYPADEKKEAKPEEPNPCNITHSQIKMIEGLVTKNRVSNKTLGTMLTEIGSVNAIQHLSKRAASEIIKTILAA